MPLDDEWKQRIDADDEGDDQTGGDQTGGAAGAGGAAGEVEFKDFLASGENLRDDLLSPEDRNRILAVHHEAHRALVIKQKDKRNYMEMLKSGKIPLSQYRQRFVDALIGFAVHPLSRTAQFSGAGRDQNMNEIPSENQAQTNDKKKEELQYRPSPSARPDFTPKLKVDSPRLVRK